MTVLDTSTVDRFDASTMSNTHTEFPVFEVYVKGQPAEFTSAFATLDDAQHYLRGLGQAAGDFARDLLAKPKLSDLQRAWIHKLATDRARPRGDASRVATGVDLSPIQRMLAHARGAGKNFPKIALRDANGSPVVLTLAGPGSRTPLSVQVTDGGRFGSNRWFGRIDPSGAVIRGREWNDAVDQLLRALAQNPALVGQQHGVATGRCCFCQLPLSTAESRSAGYGPVCAEHHGLPWGDTAIADAEDAAAKAAGASLVPPAAPAAPASTLTPEVLADPFRGLSGF